MISPISPAVYSATAIEYYGAVAALSTAAPPQSVGGVDIQPTVRPVTPVSAVNRQTPDGRQLGFVIDTYA